MLAVFFLHKIISFFINVQFYVDNEWIITKYYIIFVIAYNGLVYASEFYNLQLLILLPMSL